MSLGYHIIGFEMARYWLALLVCIVLWPSTAAAFELASATDMVGEFEGTAFRASVTSHGIANRVTLPVLDLEVRNFDISKPWLVFQYPGDEKVTLDDRVRISQVRSLVVASAESRRSGHDPSVRPASAHVGTSTSTLRLQRKYVHNAIAPPSSSTRLWLVRQAMDVATG